jgi:O-antigen/teichoic acid export membrane protein
MNPTNTLSLKQRVLQSGSWTFVGYGVSQALRLGGNLILTRLLFPEAFGMMAIIQAAIFGVVMLSDMGLGQSIIQNERGNNPTFVNTAWTIQVIRGFLAWIVLCAIAMPIAHIYGEPMLAWMLPVVGLGAVIAGFNSTKLFTAQRNLELARATQIDVGTYALGLIITIYLAWLLQSVWALVWGQLITFSLKMIASHIMLHGIKNQFAWDRGSLDHLIRFGRWVLLSSTLTFLSVEGARLLIGAMLDLRQLALFTLASTMNLMFWQAVLLIAGKVFFSAYSEVYRSNPNNLVSVLNKARLTIILPSWVLSVIFLFFGSQIMHLLYDDRYHDSGTMLELLAAGSLVQCIWGSYLGVLMATGKVATETMLTAAQIVLQIALIYIGYHYWKETGIIIGVAASSWIMYPVSAFVMHRHGLWNPKIDFIFLTASVLTISVALPHLT